MDDFASIMVLLVLLGIGLLIAIIYLMKYVAELFYDVAVAKGHTNRAYFWLSFLLGVAGYLLVVALPDLETRKLIKTMASSQSAPTPNRTATGKAATSTAKTDDALPEL